MSYESYSDQMKNPLWQKKRLHMLESKGWKCEVCGAEEKTLHVHHKQYKSGAKIWEYEDNELAVLCEGCHKHFHIFLDDIKQAIIDIPPKAFCLMSWLIHDFSKLPVEVYEYFLPFAFEQGSMWSIQIVNKNKIAEEIKDEDLKKMLNSLGITDDTINKEWEEIKKYKERIIQDYFERCGDAKFFYKESN